MPHCTFGYAFVHQHTHCNPLQHAAKQQKKHCRPMFSKSPHMHFAVQICTFVEKQSNWERKLLRPGKTSLIQTSHTHTTHTH